MTDRSAGMPGGASAGARHLPGAGWMPDVGVVSEDALGHTGADAGASPMDVNAWIEMHRHRMELIAAYREAARSKAEGESLRLRQAANRLSLVIRHIERGSSPQWDWKRT
ncbi:MAG: hypothetical protein N3A38_13290 [Planctomycetota bacterium]|nr:hypothetical protein [Planctomycetota bacterium]